MTPIRPGSRAHRTNKWYAYDASNDRLRLFTTPAIGAFGLAVALGLAAMFPHKGLEDQLARTNRTDPLTVEYLKAFIAAQPEAPRLRLMLARAQIQLGRYDEARATLRPFAEAPR